MGNGGVESGHTPFLAEDSRLTDAGHVVGTPADAHPVGPTNLRALTTPRFEKSKGPGAPLGQ